MDFYGFPYPTSSVVIRIPSGRLWVWSPVPLDEGLRTAVRQMLDWNPRRVVTAHGAWIDGDGRAYLERAFGWLL